MDIVILLSILERAAFSACNLRGVDHRRERGQRAENGEAGGGALIVTF